MSNSKNHSLYNNSNYIKSKYLISSDLELREYQIDIVKNSVGKNSLVILPTGLGKTIIALLITVKMLEYSPMGSKVIIMAPTRPLLNQHYETFKKYIDLPKDHFFILTGKINPNERPTFFNNHQILFYTPQTLRNDLTAKKYILKNVSLIIFDEVHHTSGDYPYTTIADLYREQNPDGTILGLTASPGSSKEDIKNLCDILGVSAENLHVRSRKDEDVADYLKPMNIYKIGVNLTSLMEKIRIVINIILEERINYLIKQGFLDIKKSSDSKKIIRKDLLSLNNELVRIINSEGDKTGAYSALSINAQGLILFHMLELIEQQGLDSLLIYLEELYKKIKKKNCSKANRILANDNRLKSTFLELKKQNDINPEGLRHPKLKVLNDILNDELTKNPESRILVFVKLRVSVMNIVKKLKSNKRINPVRFVGQSSKSNADKGLSQKKQIEILEKFKKGEFNTLVSTNVGEEGLDIAECDIVIFYDVVASEIRYIQRRGRTARHREGKVIILYCRKTNDEIYLRIALNRLKHMRKHLKKKSHFHVEKDLNKKSHRTQIDMGNYVNPSNDNLKRDIEYEEESKSHEDKKNTKIRKNLIEISSQLDMKFGLRSRLQKENIPISIAQNHEHIIIARQILLQIYKPTDFNGIKLLEFYNLHRKDYSLIIFVLDFIEFQEHFSNEKHLVSQKIKDFCTKFKLRMITIDTPEELFFFLNEIYNKKFK